MSIRILALVIDGYGGGGGIAQYNRDLVDAWSTLDWVERVDILPRFPSPDGRPLPEKVFEHGPIGSAPLYAIRAVARALRRKPCDAVFCGHLHMMPVAATMAGIARVPLWLQIHGIEAWRRRAGLVRRSVERADLVTAVSRHTRRRFLAWADIAPHRVPVLPNTMGEQFSTDIDRSVAKDALGLAGKRVLLSVSRLARSEAYKGHDRIIRSLAGIRESVGDLVYVIAGEGDLRADLEEQASGEGVADFVRFTGTVENPDLPMLYRAADVFAMPSTGEGFGIVYLEAMACGTPVIAGGADGARDPLQDGRLGVLSSDETLAADIVALLSGASRAGATAGDERALSTAARRHFGHGVFTDLVETTTERLVHAGRNGPPAVH